MPTAKVDMLAVSGLPNLMRFPQVIAATGLSRSTIYKLINAGKFPRPMKLGGKINGWRGKDISNWIESQRADD